MGHAQQILSQEDITTDTLTTIVDSYAFSAETMQDIARDHGKVLTSDFYESLEVAVMQHAPKLNAHQAVELLGTMYRFASTECVECFDRLIGGGIDELSPGEIASAFIYLHRVEKAHVRPKIITLLTKRISDCIERLTVYQLGSVASVMDPKTLEIMKLGNFILSKTDMMTEVDLQICLFALRDSADHRFKLEALCAKNLYHTSLETVGNILYQYAAEKRGSQTFIDELVTRVESCDLDDEVTDARQLLQLLGALKMCGRTDSAVYREMKARVMESDVMESLGKTEQDFVNSL